MRNHSLYPDKTATYRVAEHCPGKQGLPCPFALALALMRINQFTYWVLYPWDNEAAIGSSLDSVKMRWRTGRDDMVFQAL